MHPPFESPAWNDLPVMEQARLLDDFRQQLARETADGRAPSWRRCIADWSASYRIAATRLEQLARLTALPEAIQESLRHVHDVSLSALVQELRHLRPEDLHDTQIVRAAIARARAATQRFRNPQEARKRRRDGAGKAPAAVSAPTATASTSEEVDLLVLDLPAIGTASPALRIRVSAPASGRIPLNAAVQAAALRRASLELEAAVDPEPSP